MQFVVIIFIAVFFSFCLQFSTDFCLFWLLDPVSLIKLPEDEGEVCLMKKKKTKTMELSHELTSRCVQYFGYRFSSPYTSPYVFINLCNVCSTSTECCPPQLSIWSSLEKYLLIETSQRISRDDIGDYFGTKTVVSMQSV